MLKVFPILSGEKAVKELEKKSIENLCRLRRKFSMGCGFVSFMQYRWNRMERRAN